MQYSKFNDEDKKALEAIVGKEYVSTEEEELLIHAVDAYPSEWVKPDVVVWPENSEQVSQIVRYANSRTIPVVARGAGSGLSGNVVPIHAGIVISFRRMNKIIKILEKDMQVVVEPGMVYDELNSKLAPYKLFFPPNPGSSAVCTIGGMVANNASGMGAVKYGVTRDYVLKLEVVLATGEIIKTGSNAIKSSTGYDLVRLFVGSEGTLGVITEITLKLKISPSTMKTAIAYFDSVSATTDAVSDIMRSGLSPAALEFLDHETISAVNNAENIGLMDKPAMLLAEFHGDEETATRELNSAMEICRKHGAVDIHIAKDEVERKRLWAGRKGAYPALVRSTPNMLIGDIVVPISKITEVVAQAYDITKKYGVRAACFGHSGDGNVHPNIMTDRANKDLWERAVKANQEIVAYAIKLGGVASGEHGIGIEKIQFMELEHGNSLPLMRSIKKLLDPKNILNPGKFFDKI
ncbi:MAG TPA: FAD-binding oxidoreductase [Candidatus Saccharimonadales bacterium]|nr:FAD-binding oxidoreductase [Candidatus Saccharimonadales bacterium]